MQGRIVPPSPLYKPCTHTDVSVTRGQVREEWTGVNGRTAEIFLEDFLYKPLRCAGISVLKKLKSTRLIGY